MSRRLLLVANPAASQFTGGAHRHIVTALSRRHEVEAVWPTSATDARRLAADAVTTGFDGVVAMGGDGIVHQVGQALIGSSTFLGIIPVGTTNVFARLLGIPRRASRAVRVLSGEPSLDTQPVVTVEATHPDGSFQTHHGLFALGFGVDADVVVAAEVEPYRKYRFGAIHYARTSLRLLAGDVRLRQPTIRAVSGEHIGSAVAVMCQFRAAFTFLGRMGLRLDPSEPDPMTALILGRLPLRRLPRLIRRVLTRSRLDTIPEIEVWKGVQRLVIAADPPARLQVDGEVHGPVSEATVRHSPHSLWTAVPSPDR